MLRFKARLDSILVVFVLNFGSEVVADMTNVSDVVLDHQGDVRGHGEGYLGGEAARLGEHAQVPACEGKFDRFLHLDDDRLLFFVNIGSLGKLDIADPNVTGGGELDSLFGDFDQDRLAELGKIAHHSLELSRGHLYDSGVVSFRNAEMLLIQVHQFHLIIGHFLLIRRLEHEVDSVGLILSLHSHDIIVGGASQNFSHAFETHPHGELAIATEFVKPVGTEIYGDEGDVGVVHSLELDPAVTAVPGGFLQQILQRFQHLLEQVALDETCLKHLFDLEGRWSLVEVNQAI